jgi:hypothetical protein
MENELTDPVFGNTPQAPPKWLVLLWCISIVAAVTTEVVRHKIEIKNEKKLKKSEKRS